MPLNANAIITIAELKSYIGKADDAIRQDDFLTLAINTISDAVEEYINGPVVVKEYTGVIYNGNGKHVLRVDAGPIVSLLTPAAADVQWRASLDGAWQTIEEDIRFIVTPRDDPWGIHLDRMVFSCGTMNIKLSYKAGWNPIPATIRKVCLEACFEMFQESGKGAGRLGIQSDGRSASATSQSTTYAGLHDRHRRELARYRRVQL